MTPQRSVPRSSLLILRDPVTRFTTVCKATDCASPICRKLARISPRSQTLELVSGHRTTFVPGAGRVRRTEPHGSSRNMTHFFEKRDRWGNGPSLWILLGCIFITPLCVWSLRHTHIENDIEHWLPDDNPNAVTLKWSMQQFKLDASDSILVSWDDSSLTDSRVEKLAERLVGKLDEQGVRRDGLKQVARVTTPRDVVTRMVEHNVDREPKWWFQASWISFKCAFTTACACRSCVAERPVWLARTTCGVSQNFASPSTCATCT